MIASGSRAVFRRIEYFYAGQERTLIFFDESSEACGHEDRRHLQGALAGGAVFQGPQAELARENLRGRFGERSKDPDLDGADRDLAAALLQAAGAPGLELVQSRPAPAATVTRRSSGLMGIAGGCLSCPKWQPGLEISPLPRLSRVFSAVASAALR